MKNIITQLGIISFLLLSFSCSKFEMNDYSEVDNAIYFYRQKYIQEDSINYTFANKHSSVIRDTIYVRVELQGLLSEEDRPIVLKQSNIDSINAAKEGVHFNFGELFIPANKEYTLVPIIVLKDPSLENDVYRLELTIAENKYFRRGIYTNLDFAVTVSSKYTEFPSWKTLWLYTFGKWSTNKFIFINDRIGGLVDWNDTKPGDTGFTSYLKATVIKAYADYRLENEPLLDDEGKEINFTDIK